MVASRQYAVLGPLASGSETRAFLACEVIDGEPRHDRPVVVVWLPDEIAEDQKRVARLQRETAFVTQLKHKNIIRVYGLEAFEEGWARVVDFVDGEPLGRIIDRAQEKFRPIDPRMAARIVADICEGVHYAHEEGQSRYAGRPIVHGGIRPDTMLVNFDGITMVTGYGASVLAPSERGPRGPKAFAYLAPEQIIGGKATASPATDIYAIGAVLYRLLSGKAPFEGTADQERAILTADPPILDAEGLEGRLGNISATALAKRGADRFDSVGIMKEALLGAMGEERLPSHEEISSFINELIPPEATERVNRARLLESAKDPDAVTVLSRPIEAPQGVDAELFEASRPGPVSTTQIPALSPEEASRIASEIAIDPGPEEEDAIGIWTPEPARDAEDRARTPMPREEVTVVEEPQDPAAVVHETMTRDEQTQVSPIMGAVPQEMQDEAPTMADDPPSEPDLVTPAIEEDQDEELAVQPIGTISKETERPADDEDLGEEIPVIGTETQETPAPGEPQLPPFETDESGQLPSFPAPDSGAIELSHDEPKESDDPTALAQEPVAEQPEQQPQPEQPQPEQQQPIGTGTQETPMPAGQPAFTQDPGQQPMQPGMQQPMQPGMQQPMMQPGMQQPGMQQPGMQPMQPGMQQPMQPGMQQPIQPGMQQPMQPGMQQPMQPGMVPTGTQPGIQQPGMVQPGMQQQPGMVPTGTQPGMQVPVQPGMVPTGTQPGIQQPMQQPMPGMQQPMQPGMQQPMQQPLGTTTQETQQPAQSNVAQGMMSPAGISAVPQSPMREDSSITAFGQKTGDSSRAVLFLILALAAGLLLWIFVFAKDPPEGIDDPNVSHKPPPNWQALAEPDPDEIAEMAEPQEGLDGGLAPDVGQKAVQKLYGTLSIKSEPSVIVFNGNDRLGKTPFTVQIEVGRHKLRFTDKQSGLNVYRVYRIRPSAHQKDNIVFGKCKLKVNAPNGARVTLNSRLLGKAPLEKVEIFEGRYLLLVSHEGATWREWFDAVPGRTIEFNVRMKTTEK